MFKVGDKVKITSKNVSEEYDNTPGLGWAGPMLYCLGKVGKVIHVRDDRIVVWTIGAECSYEWKLKHVHKNSKRLVVR